MHLNPMLKKLGLNDDDRVVIIHTDDIGMCQSSVAAFADLWEDGGISSGAIMIPCAWAPAAAAYAREHPEADLGVHLTLTSEWDTYRWGPISSRKPESGMMDAEGFFPRTCDEVQQNGDPAFVKVEIAAQVERAISWGILPTHVDTHMGSIAHPKYMMDYVQVAQANKLPPMIFRLDRDGWKNAHPQITDELAVQAEQMVLQLEEAGLPMLDNIKWLDLDVDPTTRLEQAKSVFDNLPVGITHFIIHPSKETPELKAITDDWRCRVADYQLFMGKEVRSYLKEIGVHIIGYRALQELIP
ncbi:MAG: polysaccharide deacetylase family protein [Anaerolineaceae bacterium]|nr:polysaccharide deacetylase family protein [Anaerolineaceae bacterium]